VRVPRKTRLTTEKDCQVGAKRCIVPGMHGYADPDEPTYGELMEEARTMLAAGEFSAAFSQAWQACLIEPLDPASSGIMEEAGKQAEPGLAAIADAVLAARREAISLLVPGHRLSSSSTLLPQQSPAGDMAGWVDAWKEAIRLARERGGN
jgi:hypothetical protein